MKNRLDILKNYYLFEGLTEAELKMIEDISKVQQVAKGKIIIKEEELGDCFYIIINGGVNIFKGKSNSFLAYLSTGSYFGEMAIFGKHAKRMASVVAASDTELLVIGKKSFETLLNKELVLANKIYKIIITILLLNVIFV